MADEKGIKLSPMVSTNFHSIDIKITNFKDGHMRLFEGNTTPETAIQDTRNAIEEAQSILDACRQALAKEFNKLSKQ